MLDHVFRRSFTRRRMQAGPFGGYVDAFATALQQAGYSRWTTRTYLRASAHLSIWLGDRRVPKSRLDQPLIARFARHLPHCVCLLPHPNTGRYEGAVAGVRHFIEFLRRGTLAEFSFRRAQQVPRCIMTFERWMRQHRGVTEATLGAYRGILIEFVDLLGTDARRYSAAGIRRFILKRGGRYGHSYATNTLTATRMFLRFHAAHRRCSPHLVGAVPAIAGWRLTSLPRYLEPADIERIIGACDTTTTVGLRDRAILLLLARLGLRAGDVCGLRLSDVEWDAGTIRVSGKNRQAARLPLPQDAGDALLAYLKARPNGPADHVFLRVRPPFQRLGFSSAVSYVVNRAAKRAGVTLPRTGAHVLRHSLASSLLRQGASLEEIGRLLRHRNVETTAQYAKVDVPALSKLARPWPTEAAE